MKYTEEQIKKVFYETFHEMGEMFFDYTGTPEENTASTENEWEEFKKNLNNKEVIK